MVAEGRSLAMSYAGLLHNIEQQKESIKEHKKEKRRLQKRIKELESDLDAALHESRKPGEEWIELPKDSEGNRYDGTSQLAQAESYKLALRNDMKTWYVMNHDTNEVLGNADECTILKEPYDKTGRTIEEGMWVKHDKNKPATKVYSIERDDFYKGVYRLYSRAGNMAGVFFTWCAEVSSEVEIVPEPLTQCEINHRANNLLSPSGYYEISTIGLNAENRCQIYDAVKDLLRLQRVLDGVDVGSLYKSPILVLGDAL